ncbi:hypothetical protein F0U44_12085 [Nocardioides humilatus]|uniref:Uncharacterized protein n=1 Tax=Nocardioides humilatus TaxID=2607660 RepID=A0A5B1LFS1_9ACTN|nr:hypothetical protein [Nocardioides humilatus]KAA1419184.1 hypothetical protein F0U44_12085 [Nocardioides humilatus]
MGDLGILKRRPSGWTPARVYGLQHRTRERNPNDEKTAVELEVEWEVHVEGGEPYRFVDARRAPVWVDGRHVGAGKKWYSVRPRRTYGLMPAVGIPCFVDPKDPHGLWIDWDTGYELHVPAWEAHTAGAPDRRVEAKEERRHENEAVVARAEAMPQPPDVSALRDVQRIYALGVTAPATVTSAADTGRAVSGVPVWRFEVELDGGRRVAFDQAVPPQSLKRYPVGAAITVYLDPEDDDGVALG